jgi:hypothetical protein
MIRALELHRLWKNAAADAEWNRQALESSNRMLTTMHKLAAEQAKTILDLKTQLKGKL